MICQHCERELGSRTVCSDCKIPARPKSLLVASVLELMAAILSLSMGNVILAIVAGWTGDEKLARVLDALPESLENALACDWSGLVEATADASSLWPAISG